MGLLKIADYLVRISDDCVAELKGWGSASRIDVEEPGTEGGVAGQRRLSRSERD